MNIETSFTKAKEIIQDNAYASELLRKTEVEALATLTDAQLTKEQDVTRSLLVATRLNQKVGSILSDATKIEQLKYLNTEETPELWQNALQNLDEKELKLIMSSVGPLYFSDRSFRSNPQIIRYYPVPVFLDNPNYEQELKERKDLGFVRGLSIAEIIALKGMGPTRSIVIALTFDNTFVL